MKRWIVLLVLSGCADTNIFGDGSTPIGDGPRADTRRLTDLPPPGEEVIYTGEPVVYAHSSDKLYKVDPSTLQVALIASFKWPGFLPDEMTDIALDRKGKMVGISYTVVYSVDPKTAVCTRLADLDNSGFNGLSYVASEIADGKELLMATSSDGLVYEIDPTTGKSKQIGNYGGGDVVSVKGLGTFATVKQVPFSSGTDWLAKIDVLTGKATLVGDRRGGRLGPRLVVIE